MTEKGDSQYIKSTEWMEKSVVDVQREKFVNQYSQQLFSFYNKYNIFSDLNTDEKQICSVLESRFFFGIKMAYRRTNEKYPIYDIKFETNRNCSLVYFDYETNSYGANIDTFKRSSKRIAEGKEVFINGLGSKIPIKETLEIAGVEEAVHLMFFNEKGNMGDFIFPENSKNRYIYHISDIESMALYWKLAYIKRYFPEYYQPLKKFNEGVTKIRRILINDKLSSY